MNNKVIATYRSGVLLLFAASQDFLTTFPVAITLVPNSPQFQCTTLDINDDSVVEGVEDLQMELRLVDQDLASQVDINRNQVTIIIQDNDFATGDVCLTTFSSRRC